MEKINTDIDKINADMDKPHNRKFKHIDDVTSLSYILQFFSVLFKKQKYKEILYNPLRNPFAHNNYFWEQDKLICVDKKNNEQEISLCDMSRTLLEKQFVLNDWI